jgi:sec-independent protein translocase protein TatA
MLSSAILAGVFGPWQVILIVVVVLLMFGGRKLPELMRGLGSGIKEFKGAMKDDDKAPNKEVKDQNN